MHKRILIEKKPEYNTEAQLAKKELVEFYGCTDELEIRVVNVYDLINATDSQAEHIYNEILYHPLLDEEVVDTNKQGFQFEYHQGGYNQRADATALLINNVLGYTDIKVKHSKMVFVSGCDLEVVKPYFINPIESKEVELLSFEYHEEKDAVKPVETIDDFTVSTPSQIREKVGIGMSDQDIIHTQQYFKSIKREPTVTEIKMLDTYWSDHCRHTTFLTHIKNIEVEEGKYKAVFESLIKDYYEARERVGRQNKPITLMDLATINMRDMKHQGILNNLEDTTENNACSVEIEINVNGQDETWLLMFKNETHNHPTEIEPFGGASTCLGGAIRDPLSGRATVYQAMRITGAGDPRTPYDETLVGKLPQRKITQVAKDGYSSYGYQIGANTGYVREFYHPGFVAKRMELGALVAAVKKDWVTRKEPQPGDVILLLGGLTGRDGIGAAVGSSTTQEKDALESAGAEVQKGNPSVERKIVRLFRNPEATRLIKKCNDFGAGGVSVAIGELADGLIIDLDKVPTKYPGLDGTEVAISESQERMAVVLDPKDVDCFIELAKQEDVAYSEVAVVTQEKKVVMTYKGQTIVDIDREFIETNGADNESSVVISDVTGTNPLVDLPDYVNQQDAYIKNIKVLNHASQKGLIEQFDGGQIAFNETWPSGMVSELPILNGKSDTRSLMSVGYNPDIANWSAYHGGYYAVLESIAKLISMGAQLDKIHLTFQEYFERLGEDPKRWGKPFSALLGAFEVQKAFDLASIGGKDSMSGSFEDIDVPPTLISFAVSYQDQQKIITRAFKKTNHQVVLIDAPLDETNRVDLDKLRKTYEQVTQLMHQGVVYSASTVSMGGIYQDVFERCLENKVGFKFRETNNEYFLTKPGALLLEVKENVLDGIVIGQTLEQPIIQLNDYEYDLEFLKRESESVLKEVFPIVEEYYEPEPLESNSNHNQQQSKPQEKSQALILVYEGTTGEYDVQRQFERVKIDHKVYVIGSQVNYDLLKEEVRASNILVLPHGYSLGNEPEVSGKAMALILKEIKEEIKDHYILGIGAGANSLLLAGLLGEGVMAKNKNNQFVHKAVQVRMLDNSSPWTCLFKENELVDSIIASDSLRLVGVTSGCSVYTKNYVGSAYNVESLCSENKRVYGVSSCIDRFDSKVFDSIKAYFEGGSSK